MSQEKPKSTLSATTGKSKHSEQVISLGKRLVQELGLEPDVDTLGRWMAHYIAELITAAETTIDPAERLRAQEKCCGAILKLWEHRSALPRNLRPLSNLENVLKAIEDLRSNEQPLSRLSPEAMETIGGPWMGFVKKLENTAVRMCRIAVLTAAAESMTGKEKIWSKQHGHMLSKEEKKIIAALDSWLSEKILWQAEEDSVSISKLKPAERTGRILEKIESDMEELKIAFKDLRDSVKPKKVKGRKAVV